MELKELISFERVVPPLMRMLPDIYAQHLARYCFALSYCANRRVLDAACGTGYGTALLGHVASRVVGVDKSPSALDFARRYHHFFGDHELVLLDLERGEFAETFDVVVSFETLEHLEDTEPFLRQVAAMGATLVCSIPRQLELAHHVRTYDFDDCRNLLRGRFAATWYGQCGTNILSDFDPETVDGFVAVARSAGWDEER
ncbi:class I SAM-dependent methyltransferase [Trichloromonas sp.]|uniref:class I SAM-dependent methyltransferase n=1 Tax=Trichloromonas sp. TaxID=3069249 RepID=UPI003D815A1E